MKNDLLLFTNSFPFGTSENFIETEILYLSTSFNKVFLLPLESDLNLGRELPSNVEIVDAFSYNKLKNEIDIKWTKKSNLYRLLQLIKEEFFNFRKPFFKNLKQRLIKLKWIIIRVDVLENFLKKNQSHKLTYYSYWFSTWATVLSLLKKDEIINCFFSRAHGYDLYTNRNKYNSLPLQNFQLKYIDKLFLISKHGYQYLFLKIPRITSKLEVSYLGTLDNGMNKNVYSNEINILSISNLIPLKRIHLIIEILKHLTHNIKWTHIGSGVLHNDLISRAKALPNNINVNFLGQINNEKVIRFLKEKPITFLINVSESEGLPFSMMEAISFGIPVVATNVGGVNEIVNSKTGLLINQNFEIKETANEIIKSIKKFNDIKFRIGVRSYWSSKFDASMNYPIFIDSIKRN